MAHTTSRPRSNATVLPLARTSTVDLVAEELRSAIYAGTLAVGAALREVDLSAQLGVSRGPLREAAQRLVQEGLLTAFPGRGLRVTRVEGDDIADVYRSRLAVEAEAVRIISHSSESARARSLSTLNTALEALVSASEGTDAWAIGDADLAFHQQLVDVAESRRLSRAMATLVIETRLISLSAESGYTVRKSISPTYDSLLCAIEVGDSEQGVAALDQQFSEAVGRLLGTDATVVTLETDAVDAPQSLKPLVTTGVVDLPST